MAKVRIANSTVTSAPSISAGIRRAMKLGSKITSVLLVVVEPLRWWVLLQPFAVPLLIQLVARTRGEFAYPRIQKQPPFEITRLQEDCILGDVVPRRAFRI